MKTGIFCISLDLELLWGRHDINYKKFIPRAKKERETIKKLLGLFEKHNIPATWAVVGHLFLDRCSSVNEIKHPEIIRPSYFWIKRDWFDLDPTGNQDQNPEWYGKDIVRTLRKNKSQEIASHSFSHVLFGFKGCSKKCAESELQACVEIAQKDGIKLESFVFPRNSVGHLDVLRKYGFRAFRGPDPYKLPFGSKISIVFKIAQLFALTPPVVSEPQLVEGIVNIPGSMYFVSAREMRKYIPKGVRVGKAKRGIDEAIKTGKVFHLWSHPTDFVDESTKLLGELEEILVYADRKRKEGKLRILPMRDIASEVLP